MTKNKSRNATFKKIKAYQKIVRAMFIKDCLKASGMAIISAVIMIAMLSPAFYYLAKNEASTFNKLTGKNVTWQDAMFSNLVIQEPVK